MSKVLLNRFLRRAVASAYGWNFLSGIKPVLKSVLLEGTMPLSIVSQNKSFGIFKDSSGNTFQLIEGLRDAVKPGWEWVCKQRGKDIPSTSGLQTIVQNAEKTVSKMFSFLAMYDFHIKDKIVLEIGCYDGSKTMALAHAGSSRVIGSDISEYYQAAEAHTGSQAIMLKEQSEHLSQLRVAVFKASCKGQSLQKAMEKIEFVEDNITKSSLSSECFDLVCSWEVLEHVTSPEKLFAQLYRLLKPGGITFHEFNPFFAINGGHSHCTLDFFWGHVLLNEHDFERYVKELRPHESTSALTIFRNSLNRMTLHDLKKYSEENGFEILSLIPWPEKSHLELLTDRTFRIAKELYPTLTAEDLISPFVWVALRKPVIQHA